jgi:putative spermidine/putrescine transport system ATP-binding protein
VAGFVGTSNILSGETAAAITNSQQAVSVRPEKIRLVAPDTAVPEGHCTAEGLVRDVVYMGMNTRYLVELDTGLNMVVVEQNLEVGLRDVTAVRDTRIRLVWPEAANNMLEDAG